MLFYDSIFSRRSCFFCLILPTLSHTYFYIYIYISFYILSIHSICIVVHRLCLSISFRWPLIIGHSFEHFIYSVLLFIVSALSLLILMYIGHMISRANHMQPISSRIACESIERARRIQVMHFSPRLSASCSLHGPRISVAIGEKVGVCVCKVYGSF